MSSNIIHTTPVKASILPGGCIYDPTKPHGPKFPTIPGMPKPEIPLKRKCSWCQGGMRIGGCFHCHGSGFESGSDRIWL